VKQILEGSFKGGSGHDFSLGDGRNEDDSFALGQ